MRPFHTAHHRPACRHYAIVGGWMLLLCCGMAAEAVAQAALVAPVHRANRANDPLAPQHPPDAVAVWTLQTRGEVSLETPVVRLRDVALLVGTEDPHWQRIGGSAIALLPTDGRRLSIERQRLADVLARHLAGQRTVHWVGPDLISVRYHSSGTSVGEIATLAPFEQETGEAETGEADAGGADAGGADAAEAETMAPLTFASAKPAAESPVPLAPPAPVPTAAPPPPLEAAAADRLIRLVQYAIDRADPTTRDQYDVQIDRRAPALAVLADARSIRLMQVPKALQPGPVVLHIQGDVPGGVVATQVPVNFQPRPLAVFSTQSIRRGDRIAIDDVEMRPLERGQSADGIITELQSVVGMEARNALHSGRPLSSTDIGLPIIIRRGDLVEVRVVGGAVTVRTSARALDNGSEGELLQVETQTPRRRLMARAVTPGVVEIITRPPQIGR